MIQVALATDNEAILGRLVDALRISGGEIVRSFESTRPARVESPLDEYTIIVDGLSRDAVTLVCTGFVNRFRLAQVEVDGTSIEGPRVIVLSVLDDAGPVGGAAAGS